MELLTPNAIIRPVDPACDLADILEVYRQCEDFLALGPVATASMEMVRTDLRISVEAGGIFCGIFDRQSGAMQGIVDFVVSDYQGKRNLASLELLMIAAPHRSRGLGEEVVRAVEEEIRRVGLASAIDSGVQVNNPKAIRFWKRMGYRIVSEPRDMHDGTIAYELWKDL